MAQRAHRPCSQRHRERGDSLVEFVVVLPVLLLIFFAILDFSRVVYAYSVVANCAREGARTGIITDDVNTIKASAENAAVGLDRSQLQVTVTNPDGDTVQVETTYNFQLLTPLIAQALGRDSLLLRSVATMYKGF